MVDADRSPGAEPTPAAATSSNGQQHWLGFSLQAIDL
jgi:hypothetical protein